jgi:FKBP-type peptidyl-prolyl cis-trans isomerase SlyD
LYGLIHDKEIDMKAQIVSLHCVLKNRLGRVLSSSYCQDVLTCAPGEGPLKGLGKALMNLQKGERRKIALTASEAYGFYDPGLVLICSKDDFPSRVPFRLGQSMEVEDDQGKTRIYRVSEVGTERVTLDANHPLAGQDLVFEIEALSARDATPEEVNSASTEEELLAAQAPQVRYAN